MEKTQRNSRFDHVFAIVRVDAFHDADVPLEDKITVKKVVRTQEDAEHEVVRLNELNSTKGAIYFWQITRLEPESGFTDYHLDSAEVALDEGRL